MLTTPLVTLDTNTTHIREVSFLVSSDAARSALGAARSCIAVAREHATARGRTHVYIRRGDLAVAEDYLENG